ncbi:XdhC family protein [Streptomyces indicus]|uniref:Xanthine dehydrogenase accessory factor n=1 Tax=Streptomyces indicus TaxID=417292 RepID=A0A1G8UKD7_9ACTN|nr:XdhC/CoxI family protein [Streptomyces indicus]SDJ54229.1 xanthine dehydrogenase accessory factor [Streptomyces indicus]
MLDLSPQLSRWLAEGREFAVATVVGASGSAPRGPGAALAVDADGTVIGSVSGGCVEGAVYELCAQALADGEPVLERFGYSDEDAFAVGLTCGGVIDVLVTPVRLGTRERALFTKAVEAAAGDEGVALARVVRGPTELVGRAVVVRTDGAYDGTLGADEEVPDAPGPGDDGTLGADELVPDAPGRGGDGLADTVAREARALLDGGRNGNVELSEDGSRCPGGLTVFVESSLPPPRMIVFGSMDFASALVRAGKFLGYHVTVCDAREVFTTRARFPDADEIVVDWPHRYLAGTQVDGRTVLCVLTHDPKFDVPLLELALRLPVAYVGAMGSRRTHEDRERRLREAGLGEGELAKLRSPIGLDLGGRTPEEVAVAIVAETVAVRYGRGGGPLGGTQSAPS